MTILFNLSFSISVSYFLFYSSPPPYPTHTTIFASFNPFILFIFLFCFITAAPGIDAEGMALAARMVQSKKQKRDIIEFGYNR